MDRPSPVSAGKPQEAKTLTEKLALLRQTITDYFNEDELQNLCFDLGVDHEILPGQSKVDKARELIAYLKNRGRMRDLFHACAKQRPQLPWAEITSGLETELDVPRLVETLRQALPQDDPAPQHLLETLGRFQRLHACLAEWKELHNMMNDIIYTVDQFSREVERMDASGQRGDPRALARQWRPVAQKVAILLDWSATVQHISSPFVKLSNGGMQGPKWAIDMQAAEARLAELLQPSNFDATALYDATCAFVDAAERHMYLADKQLRETVGELYNLSSIVLGSISHDQV